mmetsp:Transcript_67061/g.193796  ORF Transcript_67061/g.193796 Transcript_67061/m.193796 type:complete len:363 (+) Transcript_67061:423-1511(+)
MDQHPLQLRMIEIPSVVQRCVPFEILDIDIDLGRQQLLGDLLVAIGHSEHQRRATIVVARLHVGAGQKQDRHYVRLCGIHRPILRGLARTLARMMQCGLLRVVDGVDVDAVAEADQVLDNVHMAKRGGVDQRGLATDVAGIDVELPRGQSIHKTFFCVDHTLDHLQVAAPRGLEQHLRLDNARAEGPAVLRVFLHLANEGLPLLRNGADPTHLAVARDLDSPGVLLPELDDLHDRAGLQFRDALAVQGLLHSQHRRGENLMLTADLETLARAQVSPSLKDERLVQRCLGADPTLATIADDGPDPNSPPHAELQDLYGRAEGQLGDELAIHGLILADDHWGDGLADVADDRIDPNRSRVGHIR